MKARKGSTHGYDIVDHTQFNPELGGEAGFERLSAALKQHDLGLILDFVPNHVGVHFADNPWWLDVLEWGQASPHAVSFDIDWEHAALSRPRRRAAADHRLVLWRGAGKGRDRAALRRRRRQLFGLVFRAPAADRAASATAKSCARSSRKPAPKTARPARRILALASRYRGLRHPNRKEAPAFKAELKGIAGGAEIIARGLDAYRAGPDRAAQTLALHHLLERQHYKLGHWRLASSDINYRRFFDVNTLAGLRVEDAGTFDAIHRLVKRLIAEGKLQGLRLDHIDGLRDPAQYFQRLRRLIRDAQGNAARPFYMVIEKILGEHEAAAPVRRRPRHHRL